MNENKNRYQIGKLYDDRIKENLSAVDAAGQWGSEKLVPKICNRILEKIEINNNDIILEIGCGSGVLGNKVKDNCNQYFGIDVSFGMLQKFQQEYNSEKKCVLIQGVSEKLPFPDNSFTKIILNSVIMYLHGDLLEKTMKEVKRVCKSNAVIFVGDNILPSDIYWEYNWFQNLGKMVQVFAKQYIKLRLNMAKTSSELGGKWKISYRTMPPEFLKKVFGNNSSIKISKSSAREIKEKNSKNKYQGNRRTDIVIKIKE